MRCFATLLFLTIADFLWNICRHEKLQVEKIEMKNLIFQINKGESS